MSISTGSISSHFSCSCNSDTKRDCQREGWAQEIIDRIHVSKDRTDVYLRKFVPSNTRCPLTDDFTDRDPFSDWTPTPGHETDSYDPLVDAFTELVSTFPEDKRPAFFGAYRIQQQFPFSAFAKDHHKSSLLKCYTFHWSAFFMRFLELKQKQTQYVH